MSASAGKRSGNPEKVIEVLLEAAIDPWIEYKSSK